jgi:phosphoserine aminotransferase
VSVPVKPARKPSDPRFGSGPTKKRPGWSLSALSDAALGRSHRAPLGHGKLREAIERTRSLLEVPADFRIGIVPASDTGAIEMAMWSLLGARPVDLFAWESFGEEWVKDAVEQLHLADCQVHVGRPYGTLPDFSQARPDADCVFTQNGTTSGARLPNFDWIASARSGLTINDATSAVFAQPIAWSKCDVVTFSWQKVLGGEAAHGMLILSPRAVERLTSYVPARPLPKIFRLTKQGKMDEALFDGSTINTPSLLATEDYLDALRWGERCGGLTALYARADANTKVLSDWVARTAYVEFLSVDPAQRSNTSVCMRLVDPKILQLTAAEQAAFAKRLVGLLERENVAFDVGSYRSAPPGLRIWCGATVDAQDVALLVPWIEWAFETCRAELPA